MKVKLQKRYKAISPFEEVELTPFSVIVGLNGTGKSQFLNAVQMKKVECDALASMDLSKSGEAHKGVVLLTNMSLSLNSEMFVSKDLERNVVPEEIFDAHCEAVFKQFTHRVTECLQGTGYDNLSGTEILKASRERLFDNADALVRDNNIKVKLIEILNEVNETLSNNYFINGHHVAQDFIQRVASHQKCEARLLTFEEIKSFGSWGDQDLFASKLPQLFAGYRTEKISNDKLASKGDRPASRDWLDADEFKIKFGIPPWEQLSLIMETFGLNYRFAPPGEREIDPVGLYFERLDDNDIHVEFHSLSAGEKVMVILAIALLNIDPFRAAVKKPQLLLMDEVDASLHPAVLHQWMTTIQEKVVKQMGIPCIMTTHSPVTVALAPEESLYEMSPEKTPLVKISKREALNKLTVGLPSMEVDFTQRRQVFVEAEVDAEAYDRIYTLVKAELQLTHSLNFLSTGIKNKNGSEEGTGCDAVKKIVNELAGYGSLSTFGLLDWDSKRSATNRIHVLAENSHYAFDNVILNPLLIGLLLIRIGYPPAQNSPKFVGIDQLKEGELQKIADAVQSKLTYPDNAATGQVPTFFINGQKTMTDRAFCECNGHDMENLLATKFPPLKAYTQKRGKLALAVINSVLGDCPGLCPKLISDAFQKLANADP